MTIAELYEKSTKGLFENIYDIFPELIFKDDISSDALDTMYLNLFGDLICANICDKLTMSEVATYVYAFSKTQLEKLYETYKAEYDPIENYNRTEETTYTKTGTVDLDQTGTDTLMQTGTDTNVTDAKIYPFGDTGTSDISKTDNTDTKNLTNTDTKNLNDKTTFNTTDTTTSTIKGNIGVTTASQMQEGVKNLFDNWNYYFDIFKMINKIITIGVYIC